MLSHTHDRVLTPVVIARPVAEQPERDIDFAHRPKRAIDRPQMRPTFPDPVRSELGGKQRRELPQPAGRDSALMQRLFLACKRGSETALNCA